MTEHGLSANLESPRAGKSTCYVKNEQASELGLAPLKR